MLSFLVALSSIVRAVLAVFGFVFRHSTKKEKARAEQLNAKDRERARNARIAARQRDFSDWLRDDGFRRD